MKRELLAALRNLTPFDQMEEARLHDLLSKADVNELPPGKVIFRRKQEDSRMYWLLEGALNLLDGNFEATRCHAGDPAAEGPLDNCSPHQVTAVTATTATVLACERTDLDKTAKNKAAKDKTAGDPTVEAEATEEGDWMSSLLASPLFDFVPPANIQVMFGKFEPVNVKAGEVVVRQGESGTHFFVIRSGRAKVERLVDGRMHSLAELEAGDNFGQDALIGDAPRSANVSMTASGTLMRLAKSDFQSLLASPVIAAVTSAELEQMQLEGPAPQVIDVRMPSETASSPIPGSVSLPLLQLRDNLGSLNEDCVYVVAGDARQAKLGAYTLSENGFTAYVLERGLAA